MRRAAFILAALLTAARPAVAAEQPADVVVLNGKVLTVDARSPKAEAVAIRDGIFVLVGSNAEAKKLVGDKTRILDAKGRTVVPGLIESHVHATGAARGEAAQPFVQLGSIGQIQDWVRARVKKAAKGEWVQTPRVDVTRIKEGRIPTRKDLDEAAPDHPVVFNWQYANHQVQVLNTRALEAAGITKETRAPGKGKVVLGADGKPTGVLENAGALVSKYLARRDIPEKEYLDSLERLLARYHEVGITSIFERNTGVEGYRVYEKLKAAGRLTARVTTTIGLRTDGSEKATEAFIRGLPFRPGDGDDWLRVGPLKIGVDGGILYGTAYMREPYGARAGPLYGFSDPTYQGDLRVSAERVKAIIRTGHRLGWQMCAHVTGDAGVDVVLDAVAAADKDKPIHENRYTLIHAYFPNPETARRAAKLGVCVDTQPAWYYKDADALSLALGGTRLKNFIGLQTWRRAGVKVAINSDHMQGFDPNSSLNPYNPFLTMYTAVTRKTERGLVIGPEECIPREEALRMMTIDAAYLGFAEKRKGSIEVGKLGDLAILSDDLLGCKDERIKEIRSVVTVVGGKVVYEGK